MDADRVTADSLIEKFGDQAYHKCVRMAAEALRANDREACRQISDACLELMQRGYHKKPQEPSPDDESWDNLKIRS